MLCAASMMLGFTSRRLLSTNLATNGNAAITSGTTDAVVPTIVPTIRRVSGNTKIINIKNGTERSTLISTFKNPIRGFGKGKMPFFSPTTSKTPSGRPITTAKRVARTVT